MKQYIELGQRILTEGELRHDRTKVGAYSVFDAHMVFDLRERFPLVTVKETRWKTAFLEMLWFLRGAGTAAANYMDGCDTTNWLNAHGCKLWNDWANEYGNLGPIYGVQWRNWPDDDLPFDQVRNLIDGLKNQPHGRRHLVSAWNVADLNEMALQPCHWAHQCYVSNDGHLDLKLFLRSSDFALGLPFNIAQYALLTELYARAAGLTARRLIVDIGDAHIYSTHVDAMREVLRRPSLSLETHKPAFNTRLIFNTDNTDIDGYKPGDFDIADYYSHDHVPLQVAV